MTMREATVSGSVYGSKNSFESVLWIEIDGEQAGPEAYGSGLTPREAVESAAAGIDYEPLTKKET